jgi:hypothetical protein
MKQSAIIAITTVVTLITLAFFIKANWQPAPLTLPAMQIATLLSPLILVAAFIERAVEIIVSPMRDPGATPLRSRLAAEQAMTPPDSQAVADAQKALADYQGVTQQYALSAAFVLGLLAAFVGVRALGVFLPTPHDAFKGAQLTAFTTYDVFLTAALLAGGASGLHSPINAFTSYFDSKASNNLNPNN